MIQSDYFAIIYCRLEINGGTSVCVFTTDWLLLDAAYTCCRDYSSSYNDHNTTSYKRSKAKFDLSIYLEQWLCSC